MKPYRFLLLIVIISISALVSTLTAQKRNKQGNPSSSQQATPYQQPKLVVGIVVDQMRYDYLTRFWGHYGSGGFKRLVNEGFNCRNNHFNYSPTSTGPGHASVYTGTTPATHGIIGNDWYDKASDASVYCASDTTQTSVGTTSDAGQMSPHRMNVTTITDQLRLHTQMRSKVIAVAVKDRGAVLPGGHTANAAYWFSGGSEGNWISSSFYMDQLPSWVNKFNNSNAVERYKKPWNTLKPISAYVESGADNNNYEGVFDGENQPVVPHDLEKLWDDNGQYGLLRITPYGNSITTDFALAAMEGEDLGQDEITDFLAISYSSTDYVGHFFGVNSKEIQDTYMRLDQDLERLLNELDKQVGDGNYTVFLTADHAAVHVPAYLEDLNIPAGYFSLSEYRERLFEFLRYRYGTTELIKNYSNAQIFLDHAVIQNLDLSVREVQEALAREMIKYEGIDRVYTGYQMMNNEYSEGIPYVLQNGYNQKRSGDILLVLEPAKASYSRTGSTHGSPQIYDTHVPLLFYGKGIRQGSTTERTEIPDIAPTIASLLGIAFPNGATGSPISEVLE